MRRTSPTWSMDMIGLLPMNYNPEDLARDFEPIPGIEVLDPEAIDISESQEHEEDKEDEETEQQDIE